MRKLPYRIFFDVNVAVLREEEEGLRNVGLGRKRKERNGKMKRRLMRSLTPWGDLSLAPDVHTNAHYTHVSTPKHHGKTTVKAVNL